MNSIKRMGVLYGRLAISSDAALIERRSDGVKRAADALDVTNLANLLRAAFGLGDPTKCSGFMDAFSEDPTFDVEPGDKEAQLLAASVLDYAIENESATSPLFALGVVTVAAQNARNPAHHDGFVPAAMEMLSYFQGQEVKPPVDRKYVPIPTSFGTALEGVVPANQNFAGTAGQRVVAAFQELAEYARSNAERAASEDNVILRYLRRIDGEMKLYWWVSSGWSKDLSRPFRRIKTPEAAIRAAKDLADKTPSDIGVFAAPALLDMILDRGRDEADLAEIRLAEAAIAPARDWRERAFGALAKGPIADLVPVTSALGLAADSHDADDWKPRFERLTGIAADLEFDPITLALQLYREQLLARALS